MENAKLWRQEGFPDDSVGMNLPARQEAQETGIPSLGQEDPLEEDIATHSSILAWRTPQARRLAGYSPWGPKEPDTTKQLSKSSQPLSKLHGSQ